MKAGHAVNFVSSHGCYLLSHSVGRPLTSARAVAAAGFYDPWDNSEKDPWPVWLEGTNRFRAVLGALFNVDAETLCPQANLSSAATKILWSLEPSVKRNVILMTEQDFPSLGFVAQHAECLGYRIRFIPGSECFYQPDVWRHYLDDDVRLALLTHVQSNTGVRIPASEIIADAREKGILTLLDVAQSAGVIPIDLQEFQPDFAIGSCVKWLCGGPGAGFLYVNKDVLASCKPLDVGWFSHENPFEFDIREFRYADSALRFWGGTPSVLPFVIAANSVEYLRHIGIDTVLSHNHALTQPIVDAVPSEWQVSPVDVDARGGTVVLNFGDRQSRFSSQLRREHVHFDERSTGIRLSPHIYNTVEDRERILTCIQSL